MNPMRIAACAALMVFSAPAHAQNLSLRGPAWAQPLLAADIIATMGGRASLAEDGIEISVRVTIEPLHGGVARVIRFDARAGGAILALRRFTGHPTSGWWLWGPDAPRVTPAAPALRNEITTLLRSATGVAATLSTGAGAAAVCDSGERAFVEMAYAGRSLSAVRDCLSASDPVGRLAWRLSAAAGSATEEDLANAALSELLAADRAFAAKAAADGVPAAFAQFAAEGAILATAPRMFTGHDEIVARYGAWPRGARLEWTPEAGRVSARGDMGWTWGNSTYIPAAGARQSGRYITVWARDLDGNWRYAFDAGVD